MHQLIRNWRTNELTLCTFQIPLNPHEMKGIADRLRDVPFEQATSTWPHRFVRKNAREILLDSIQKQLHHMGLVEEGGKFRVRSKSEMEHERVYK
jgi:ligand-binding SRPBCC domain-containing protein